MGKNRSGRYLIAFVLAISTLTATPAHASIVSFNCPIGGGTYQVDTGTLTGSTGTCSGDLTLDGSVTTIDTYSLTNTSLNTLTIPSSVTSISGAPFSNSNTLTAISVNVSNPNYSSLSGVLFNKTQTELIVYPASKPGTTYVIPSSVTSTRYYAFAVNKNLTSMNLPNTLTTLGGQTFISSLALSTVNIGTGLTNLGEQSFAWIPTLTSINVDASNTSFASIGGVLYDKNISKLWAYPANKAGTSYTAPSTVTSTAYTVFASARNLETVDLTPVATLAGQEFMDSTVVKEVIFGNSLTILVSQVFQSASGLVKLTLGACLTTIQNGAFFGNNSLNSVIYAGKNPTILNYGFPNSVVPVASLLGCPPAFTLSPSTISVTTGSPVTSYEITSTGGAIASFSISPAISNTPGLAFSTSTGLITGTPTTVASSTTYTITATNGTSPDATGTFNLTINAPEPTPAPPTPPAPPPSPTPVVTALPPSFLKVKISPTISQTADSYTCDAGSLIFWRYGVTQEPAKLTYQKISLLSNGKSVTSFETLNLSVSFAKSSTWTGSTMTCQIYAIQEHAAATFSSLNSDKYNELAKAQRAAIKAADTKYFSDRTAAYDNKRIELRRISDARAKDLSTATTTAQTRAAEAKYRAGLTQASKTWKAEIESAIQKRASAKAETPKAFTQGLENSGLAILQP